MQLLLRILQEQLDPRGLSSCRISFCCPTLDEVRAGDRSASLTVLRSLSDLFPRISLTKPTLCGVRSRRRQPCVTVSRAGAAGHVGRQGRELRALVWRGPQRMGDSEWVNFLRRPTGPFVVRAVDRVVMPDAERPLRRTLGRGLGGGRQALSS